MNNSNKKISHQDLLNSYRKSFKEGYFLLVESGIYLYNYQPDFWELLKKEYSHLLTFEAESSDLFFARTFQLQLFGYLIDLYSKEAQKLENEVVAMNPSKSTLIKTMFLVQELSDNFENIYFEAGYNFDSLSALKETFFSIEKYLNPNNQKDYSIELFNQVKQLLEIRIEQKQIFKLLDLFLYSDFELNYIDINKGWILEPSKSKTENKYLIEKVKSIIKSQIKWHDSNNLISNEGHFKKIDPTFKTNEGLATMFHSSNVEFHKTPEGQTAMAVDNEIFEKIKSTDENERKIGFEIIQGLMLEQNFHYQFRNAFTKIFQPNDNLDIHDFHILLGTNTYVSLYTIFSALSSLIAFSDLMRYYSYFPDNTDIQTIKNNIFQNFAKKYSALENKEKIFQSIKLIANNFKDIDEIKQPFSFHPKEYYFAIFKKIEDLKDKSDEELELILDLFSNNNGNVPFMPLFKLDNNYYLSWKICLNNDLNKILYDYFISKKLYVNQGVRDIELRKEISNNANLREKKFNISIKKLFSEFTNYVEANVEYPGINDEFNFGELHGDFDTIAYFEDENILIPIQVKLSNSTIINTKNKLKWVDEKINRIATNQINKDLTILKIPNGNGLKFISRIFNLNYVIPNDVKIYPLIVIDNFYCDHEEFIYSTKNDKVKCISYFELENLLGNVKIHPLQKDYFLMDENFSIKKFIEIIEQNLFWDFIEKIANEYSEESSITKINDKFKIALKI